MPIFVLIILVALYGAAQAHEQWVLTPGQMQEWDAKPLPDLFASLSPANAIPTLAFLAFLACWVRLGFTGARELFPDLQARLASHGDIVAPILRFCLAWALLSSALGAEPRVGVPAFSAPTLFAPDLLLMLLSPGWAWLRWAEIVISLALLLGITFGFSLPFSSAWAFWALGCSAPRCCPTWVPRSAPASISSCRDRGVTSCRYRCRLRGCSGRCRHGSPRSLVSAPRPSYAC